MTDHTSVDELALSKCCLAVAEAQLARARQEIHGLRLRLELADAPAYAAAS